MFVHRSILPEFLERLVEKTRAMKVGDPMEDDTMVGATISPEQAQKVLKYVSSARDEVRREVFQQFYVIFELQCTLDFLCIPGCQIYMYCVEGRERDSTVI